MESTKADHTIFKKRHQGILLPGILLLIPWLPVFCDYSGSIFSKVGFHSYIYIKLNFTLLSFYGLITPFTNTLSLLLKINEIPGFFDEMSCCNGWSKNLYLDDGLGFEEDMINVLCI